MRTPLRVLSGQILIRPFIKRIRDDECRGSSKARLLKQHFPVGDETARVHERAINFCHERRDASAAEQSPPSNHPRRKCARRTRVYMRSREMTRGRRCGRG